MILISELKIGSYFKVIGLNNGNNRRKVGLEDLTETTVQGLTESEIEGIPMSEDWISWLKVPLAKQSEARTKEFVHQVQKEVL